MDMQQSPDDCQLEEEMQEKDYRTLRKLTNKSKGLQYVQSCSEPAIKKVALHKSAGKKSSSESEDGDEDAGCSYVDMDTGQTVETPLIPNGKRETQQNGYNSLRREDSLGLDPEVLIKQLENHIEIKPWSITRQAKTSFLFIVVLAFSIMFSIYPDLENSWHLVTAYKQDQVYFNVSTTDEHLSVLKVYVRAKFLYSYPTEHTNNLYINVTNPLTGNTKVKIYVLAVGDEQGDGLEEIQNKKFDFSDSNDPIPDNWLVELTSNILDPVSVDVSFLPLSKKVNGSVVYAGIILIAVYVLIIFEIVHRTIAAMIGAIVSLAILAEMGEKPSLATVMEWLDYETLVLLFGMMIIVSILVETGVFDWIALKAYIFAGGKTWPLITILCVFGGLVSAFLDNVTTILLFAPVTIRLCEALGLDAIHILIAEVMFSNIGGTATAIGDPPNVLIVGNKDVAKQGINFGSFTLHMSVGCLFVSVAAYGLLRLLYRNRALLVSKQSPASRELQHEIDIWKRAESSITVVSREENTVKALLNQKVLSLESMLQEQRLSQRAMADRQVKLQLADMKKRYKIRDYRLLVKSAIVLVVVILMFFLSSFVKSLYLTVGWIPLVGALWLLVLSDHHDLDAVLHRIEWATLLFFAALFVLMEALTRLGLIEFITVLVRDMIESVHESGRLPLAIIVILWVSALASSFIDNIPFTTAMLPVILNLAGDTNLNLPLEPMVWALAFGACLGGNGTLIGASCNVVCAGIAETHGHKFTFTDFLKVGFPMMLVTNFIAMCYLLICHVAFTWH